MNDLRTSLHRVADAVEPLPVDGDLWQRGVAARRRGQALVVAAVLAIIVSITWSAVLLRTQDREARTASSEVVEGGAIPSRIIDIDPDLDLTGNLAVGRASAAFISATDDVVVITADDGVPHRLVLPGRAPSSIAMALSPDGRSLAYQQGGAEGAQIAVLDLDTGRRSVLLVQGGDPLTINSIGWSPRGEWLAWAASAVATTPSSAGRIRADGSGAWRIEPDFNAVSAAIADNGTVALGNVSGGVFVKTGSDPLERRRTFINSAPAAFSPNGSLLALATAPRQASYTLDLAGGTVLEHPFPDNTFGTAVVRPLGWVDDRIQLLLVQDADGGELVVTTPQVDDTSTWRRSVGEVDGDVMSSVSLAVDLLPDLDGTSSQQLTHDFGDVLAPSPSDISWVIGLGVAAAIAVLMALRWLWRRFVP